VEVPVPPLEVPGLVSGVQGSGSESICLDTLNPAPCTLTQFPSVQLLVDRAQAVRPDFQVTKANAAAVSLLCQRLEGLPLALELAAARAGVMTPAQMIAHLGQRFEFLTRRGRGADPRHQSLRAALDWSYQLLTPELQRFFARLSVFRGGFTLEAAAAVLDFEWPILDLIPPSDEPPIQTPEPPIRIALEYLEQLQVSSLIVAEEPPSPRSGAPGLAMRYRLLETLREYGAEQLSGKERAALHRRHGEYFLALAEAAEPMIRGPEQRRWSERVERELDNLRAALAWSQEEGSGLIRLRLAGALFAFWDFRGYLREGREWLEAALARSGGLPGARSVGEHDPGSETDGERPEGAARAKALYGAGALALFQGDYAAARPLQEASVALWRALGQQAGLAHSLRNLGMIALRHGECDRSSSLLRESLAIFQQIGNSFGTAWALNCLGAVAAAQGDYITARSLYEQCLPMFKETGDQWSLVWVLLNLGDTVRLQGEPQAAEALYRGCLSLSHELGLNRTVAFSLEGLAEIAVAEGRAAPAARLFGAAEALRELLGAPLPPADRAGYERQVAVLRARLGEAAFAAEWNNGRALTWQQAAAL
jgi:tetratricopeptide (TPR) repeat protein